jgi:hypothetical protein
LPSWYKKNNFTIIKNQGIMPALTQTAKHQFKEAPMPALKLKQLQYEADTWKRLLGFITDENIHLKNRLSEILKNQFDDSLLGEMENFQTGFLKEDQRIGLLKNDVAELDKLFMREIFEDGQIITQVDHKLKKLRGNIKIAEAQFTKLKMDFNNYLSENIIQSR